MKRRWNNGGDYDAINVDYPDYFLLLLNIR